MNKILSISVAAYNVEKFLDQTLSSLCVQDVLDKIEIIIVNDGSSDKTDLIAKEYVEKYSDSFILINKKNGGYGSTINSSLEIATGKYYKLLDGDDWFYSDNLATYIKTLNKIEADIIYTPFFIYENDLPPIIESFSLEQVISSSEIYALSMHAMAVRTNLIKHRIKITEHCFYTDFEFAIKCLDLASTLYYFDCPIYCYRLGRDGQSVSLRGYLKHLDNHEAITKMVMAYVYKSEKHEKVRSQIDNMIQRHLNLLILSNDKQRYISFLEYIKNNNYKNIKITRGFLQTIVRFFPNIFYYPISYIKRKKNGIC